MKKIKNRIIDLHQTVLVALKQMDRVGVKSLLVLAEGDLFQGILSIGDIQRSIIRNEPLEQPIKTILRMEPRVGYVDMPKEDIKTIMTQYRMELFPIIDKKNRVVQCYLWEDFFPKEQEKVAVQLNLPVVIMAGGEGTRLKPLTNVIPKPLIPLGEKTIVEDIMDRFERVGCDHFFISINYMAETIRHYFSVVKSGKYNIDFFQEEKPLGTAGSLHLVKNDITTTFFVTNCDILVDEDYSEILNYHYANKNELTIVSALKHIYIPYGTIETEKDGLLTRLVEKPELTFQLNTGFYILEPHLLKEIPQNEIYHITSLIETVKNRKGRVGVFPVSQNSWVDMGTFAEYVNLLDKHDI